MCHQGWVLADEEHETTDMGATASHPDNHNAGRRRDNQTSRDDHPLNIERPSTLNACVSNDASLERFPTKEITWNFGGQSVLVTGAWDNWSSRVALNRLTTTDFSIHLTLPPGTYQYKYIVDGAWKYVRFFFFSFTLELLHFHLFLFPPSFVLSLLRTSRLTQFHW